MSQPPRGPISCPSCHDLSLFLVHRRNFQRVAVQPGLDRSATLAVVDFVCRFVIGANRQELGLEPMTKDPGAAIAGDACHRLTAQRAVNVDRAAGDDFGSGAYRAEYGDVALHEGDRLAGTNRFLDQQRRWLFAHSRSAFRGWGCGRGQLRLAHVEVLCAAAATQDGRKTGRLARLDTFNSEDANIAFLKTGDEMRDTICA